MANVLSILNPELERITSAAKYHLPRESNESQGAESWLPVSVVVNWLFTLRYLYVCTPAKRLDALASKRRDAMRRFDM